jgi:hypothetical protein
MLAVGTKVIVKEYFTEYIGTVTKGIVNGFYEVTANGHLHSINENNIVLAKETE